MLNDDLLKILDSLKDKDALGIGDDVNETVLLIDGLNSFIRGFSCSPAMNDNGDHIGGISGFLKTIAFTIRQFKPSRCIIVFDGKGGSSRRKKKFPAYKDRKSPKTRLNRAYDFQTVDEEIDSMNLQLMRVVQYIEYLPLTILNMDDVEADDVIAYIATEILSENPNNKSVIISSTDRDYLQLIDERVKVWNPTRKIYFDEITVHNEYKIPQHNFLMYRILDGDKSDGIPGIRGIGFKTIQKKLPILLSDTKITIESLLEYVSSNNDDSKLFKTILASKDILERNYDLMQLNKVDMPMRTKTRVIEIMNMPIKLLNSYQFKKMVLMDKMYSAIPNIDTWLTQSFNILNSFAMTTQKG